MRALALTSKCINRLHPRMAYNRFDLIPHILRKAGFKFENIPPFWQEQITKAKEKLINQEALGLGDRLKSLVLPGTAILKIQPIIYAPPLQGKVYVLNQCKINEVMPNLTNLDLMGFSRENAEGVQQIALSLNKLTSFKSRVIDDSFLKRVSIERLPIKQLKGVLVDITDIGAQHLACLELEKLELLSPLRCGFGALRISAANLNKLALSFRNLTKLTCHGIDNSLLQALSEASVPLKSLTALRPRFEDNAVHWLEKFPLNNLKLIVPRLSDVGIETLAGLPQAKALRTLTLFTGRNDFTVNSFAIIATHFPNLRALSISWVPFELSMGLSHLAKASFNALRSLQLHCNFLKEREVVRFLETAHLPVLQKLELAYTTDKIMASVQQLKNPLSRFEFSLWDELTDQGVAALSLSHHRLKGLALSSSITTRITDASLKSIANGTMELDELYLNELDKITDDGLIALAESKKPIRKLIIKHHPIPRKTAKVTDWAIKAMRNFGLPREELVIDLTDLDVTRVGLNTLAFMPLKKLKVQALNTMFDENSLKVFRSLCRADEVELVITNQRTFTL